MKIIELIQSLEKRALLSDKGMQAEVKIVIHAGVVSGSFCEEVEIDDVSGVWGQGVDEVHIDVVPEGKQIKRLNGIIVAFEDVHE